MRKKKIGLLMGSIAALAGIFLYNESCTGIYRIKINELQSSNSMIQNQIKYSEYVELYNTGLFPIHAKNLYLSDDPENLQKFSLGDLTMERHGYALVNPDRNSLRLKRKGDQTIYLSDETGHVIDKVTLSETENGQVNCRERDGADGWKVASATPGYSNEKAVIQIESPVFSHTAGYYESEFDLELTSQNGAAIYYTVDGRDPTEASTLYTGPIHVYDRSAEENVLTNDKRVLIDYEEMYDVYKMEPEHNKVFIVKARAIDGDGGCSDIVTATYLIDKEGYKDHTVLSIVGDTDALFGEDGIWVTGKEYDDWYLGTREGEPPAPNFTKKGIEYEVPVSLEVFSPDQTYEQQAGLRVSGDSTRQYILKPFALYSRKEYSGSEYFAEDWFQGVKSHKVRAKCNFIEPIIQKICKDRAVATLGSRRAVIFMNGEHYIDMNLMEHYDALYFKEHYGIDEDNIIVYKNGSLKEGPESPQPLFWQFYEYARTHDMSVPENYEAFGEMVDLQSYIDLMSIRIYIDDMDFSQSKNYVLWKTVEKTDDAYADGRWRWALYDLDAMERRDAANWGLSQQAEKNTFSLISTTTFEAINQQSIFVSLKQNEEFCRRFVNTFLDLVNSTFCYENVMNSMIPFYEGLERPMYADYCEEFFRNRPQYIVPYLAEEFGLTGDMGTVSLEVNDPLAGSIRINTITPQLTEGSWQGQYFTDVPVELTAVPNEGYEFVRWEQGPDSNEAAVSYQLKEGENHIYAVFEKK